MPGVKSSILDKEAIKIAGEGIASTNKAEYRYIIHTGKFDMYSVATFGHFINRDYVNNMTDYIKAVMGFPIGDYVKFIIPERDDLEITVIRKLGPYTTKYRYKAILANYHGEAEASKMPNISKEELNTQDIAKVEIQCLDRFSYQFRNIAASFGSYKDTTVSSVLSSLITQSITKVSPSGENRSPRVHISTPNNTRKYEHIVIPNGVKADELPFFLQNSPSYGVYSAGMGMYVQDYPDSKGLFVYPLYNTKSQFTVKRKITFVASVSSKNDLYKARYMKVGMELKVLVTASTVPKDIGNINAQEHGMGSKWIEETTVAAKSVVVEEDAVHNNKKDNVQAIKDSETADGTTNHKWLGVISNPYKHLHKALAAKGHYIAVQWNYAVLDYIEPGMECTYLSLDTDDKPVRRKGVIHKVHAKLDVTNDIFIATIIIFMLGEK